MGASASSSMLHVQKLDVYQPSIEFLAAMESASNRGVMRVDELIDAELYARGTPLLERIVAMRTKRIDP